MDPEKEALEEYKEAGVELPDNAEPTDSEEETTEEAEETTEDTQEETETTEEEEEEEEEPQKPKKRSIYQDLKETRKDARSEKELREKAEQERDALQEKLDATATEETPAAPKVAAGDLDAFAKEIGADPAALTQMRELFLKDLPRGEMPEGLEGQLKEFQDWQKGNSEAMETVAFDNEFKQAQPELTKMFPKATAEETEAIKAKIQELAHTEEFHDKEVEYIAFKNNKALSALVSPKKRGLESKGKGDVQEDEGFTFDPNADISKLSPKEQEAWEKAYNKATSSDTLETDSEGRKIIL